MQQQHRAAVVCEFQNYHIFSPLRFCSIALGFISFLKPELTTNSAVSAVAARGSGGSESQKAATHNILREKNKYNKRRQQQQTVRSSCPRCSEKGLSWGTQEKKQQLENKQGIPFLTRPRKTQRHGRTGWEGIERIFYKKRDIATVTRRRMIY